MLRDCDLVAFIPTTDIARARAFFTDVLGLTVLEDTPFACVLDAHATTVRVTPVHSIAPAPYAMLGWSVPEMGATMRDLIERGVVFERFDDLEQDELGVWTAPGGDQVAWFKDLDGNILSLSRYAESDA